MRIAVRIAVGGVGGYFGGRLAQAGEEVHLIARGAHLEAIRRNGLPVRSVAGDFEVKVLATDDPAEVGPVDHVLFCVKAYDTGSAAPSLRPLLREGTGMVSLQNGVDNEDVLTRQLGERHVMGGVAFIFSAISEPGVIAQTGGPCRILVGEMDCSRSDRVEELGAACRAAQIDAEATGDIRLALWDKLAFICAQAGMTAAVRLPMARSARCWRPWRSSGGSSRRFEPSPRPRESSWPKMRWTATKRSRAASSRDSSRPSTTTWCGGRRMELEALHGSVVRRAGVHGVPAPASEAVYAILRPWAVRNEQSSG